MRTQINKYISKVTEQAHGTARYQNQGDLGYKPVFSLFCHGVLRSLNTNYFADSENTWEHFQLKS